MNTRDVQKALHALGLAVCCGKIDGAFGDDTRHAVTWFQQGFSWWDLKVDSWAGPKTWEALRHALNQGGKIGRWFKAGEFASKRNGHAHVHRELVRGLDAAREKLGRALVIQSGYRDPIHNYNAGGVPNSQHLYGAGADIEPNLPSVDWVRGLGMFSGIGKRASDGTVAHVDVRHIWPDDRNTTKSTTVHPAMWHYS